MADEKTPAPEPLHPRDFGGRLDELERRVAELEDPAKLLARLERAARELDHEPEPEPAAAPAPESSAPASTEMPTPPSA